MPKQKHQRFGRKNREVAKSKEFLGYWAGEKKKKVQENPPMTVQILDSRNVFLLNNPHGISS